MRSWIILVDERRAGGLLSAAKALGGETVAVAVGPKSLAGYAAGLGFDRVLLFETAEGVPAEAYAPQVAAAAAAAAPNLVLASDAASGRVLLGAVAAKLEAALLGSVRKLSLEGGVLVAGQSAADGRAIADIEIQGALAAIYDGEDVQMSGQAVQVEEVALIDPGSALRLGPVLESAGGEGLLTATRVVGAGMGLGRKENLRLIEDLAAAIGAETACTLPACDDMRWFPSERVVGSSHNQIAPDLYIGVGISGQPQHVTGIRDAKIVVAINNDPEARFLKNCNYGILGDLNEIVPALTEALKKL